MAEADRREAWRTLVAGITLAALPVIVLLGVTVDELVMHDLLPDAIAEAVLVIAGLLLLRSLGAGVACLVGQIRSSRRVARAEDLVGGPDTPSKVTVSFDLASREAVDDLVERARAAGGRIGDTDEYPFMYQRQFDDPDGYHWSPFWMHPADEPA